MEDRKILEDFLIIDLENFSIDQAIETLKQVKELDFKTLIKGPVSFSDCAHNWISFDRIGSPCPAETYSDCLGVLGTRYESDREYSERKRTEARSKRAKLANQKKKLENAENERLKKQAVAAEAGTDIETVEKVLKALKVKR